MTAPPGFPIPAFVNQAHTICPGLQNTELEVDTILKDITVWNKTNEEALIGKEGAMIWKKHFAPSLDSTNVI